MWKKLSDDYGRPAFDPAGEHWLNILTTHPAVQNHGNGVSSKELASFIGHISSFAQERVMGDGKEQYEKDDHQVFENVTPSQLALAALEEFADGINYLGMIAIKMLSAYRAMANDPDA